LKTNAFFCVHSQQGILCKVGYAAQAAGTAENSARPSSPEPRIAQNGCENVASDGQKICDWR
jgi:hypothetical protein